MDPNIFDPLKWLLVALVIVTLAVGIIVGVMI